MFRPIESNVSVYKKVVSQIQNMIMSGELKKGDRLPPERQLAEMLQVGRPTVKQAISALEAMGIVTSRQGDGNYITSDSETVFSPLVMQFYLDNGEMDDLLEFRYILETQMAALAATKITTEQIREFDALMAEIKAEIPEGTDVDKRTHYNQLFHTRIIDICNNRLIKMVYSSLMELIGEQLTFTDGVQFYESHMLIFEAIRDGKPAEAAYYMSEHFKNKFPNYRYYHQVQREII